MTDLIEERMKEALIRFEGLVLDRDEDAMPFLGADARDLFPGAIKEIEEMRKERDAWRKVMQSMTPQGSEYSTPEACAAFVAMEREDRHNARVDRVKANRRTEAAEAKANVMVADKINLRSELLSVEAKLAKAVEALEKTQKHVNWMENTGSRLNRFVFDYIDDTLAEIGEP